MRQISPKAGVGLSSKPWRAVSKSVPPGVFAVGAAGIVAGSAIAYALFGQGIDQAATAANAAVSEEQLTQSGVEVAALPQSGLPDTALFSPSTEPDTATEAALPPSATPVEQPQTSLAPPAPALDGESASSLPPEPQPDVDVALTEEDVLALELRLASEGDPSFALPELVSPQLPVTDQGILAAAELTPEAEPAPESPVDETAAIAAIADTAVPEPAANSGQDQARWTGMVPASANAYVNLRDAPDNDSNVIRVVAFGDALSVEADCPSWCAVVHEGTQGYIYQSFISRPGG